MSLRGILVIASICVLSQATVSHAGMVMLGQSNWQAEWDASLDQYVQIQFDAQIGNTLYVEKFATFTQGPGMGGLFPTIPIIFRQIGPSTISKIVITDESLMNLTGVDWTDFHWDLLDGPTTVFDNSPGFFFSTSPLTNQHFSGDLKQFWVDGFGLGPNGTNAVVPNGSSWFPGSGALDGNLVINVVSKQEPNYTVFTFKETPTPEPGTLLLLTLAGVPMLRRRS